MEDQPERPPTQPGIPASSPDRPFEVDGELPQDFGDYQLLEQIGRGANGVVYRARQRSLDRVVAIKVLASHRLDEAARRALHKEARTAAQVRHPHCVAVHEVGQQHGVDYIAMELVDGGDLTQLLADPPAIDEAVFLLEKVARAVDALHDKELVHLDLKPANILIDGDGEPRVTDFGLAQPLGRIRLLGRDFRSGGTPAYMAPEQVPSAKEKPPIGTWTDVFSLGTVCYQLLTGVRPFGGPDVMAMLLEISEKEPVPLRQHRAEIPRALELIILRCLEKEPEDRYATAGKLADDLQRFSQGEVVTAQPMNLARRVERWARRDPVFVAHLLGIGVMTAIAQIWYALGIRDAGYYAKVNVISAVWLVACFVLSRRGPCLPQFKVAVAWTALDLLCFTAILTFGEGNASPLILCYPLLQIASGLWFRRQIVWIATAATMVTYTWLMLDCRLWHQRVEQSSIRDVTFMATTLLIGLILAQVVHRVDTLRRFVELRTEGERSPPTQCS